MYPFYNKIFLKARTSSTMFGIPLVVRVLQFHKPDSNGTMFKFWMKWRMQFWQKKTCDVRTDYGE